MILTYNIGDSSFVLLNSSNPPSFHSPEGEMKIAFTEILPWDDKHGSFKNAKAT